MDYSELPLIVVSPCSMDSHFSDNSNNNNNISNNNNNYYNSNDNIHSISNNGIKDNIEISSNNYNNIKNNNNINKEADIYYNLYELSQRTQEQTHPVTPDILPDRGPWTTPESSLTVYAEMKTVRPLFLTEEKCKEFNRQYDESDLWEEETGGKQKYSERSENDYGIIDKSHHMYTLFDLESFCGRTRSVDYTSNHLNLLTKISDKNPFITLNDHPVPFSRTPDLSSSCNTKEDHISRWLREQTCDGGVKRRRRVTKVQRLAANERERRRMDSLNVAFSSLRALIPQSPDQKRLSRIQTLRYAIDYIGVMTDLLKMERVVRGGKDGQASGGQKHTKGRGKNKLSTLS